MIIEFADEEITFLFLKSAYNVLRPKNYELIEKWTNTVSPVYTFGQLEPVDLECGYIQYSCAWEPKKAL